jgi:DNA-binding HxlR family transcriptional regulator
VTLSDLPGKPCPIAASLELVGERWALLVVREIAQGSVRFTDIVAGTGAPRDRVAARLRTLEAAGVVRREQRPGSSRSDYQLTESGRDLVPVLNGLLQWGARHAVDPEDPLRRPWADLRVDLDSTPLPRKVGRATRGGAVR